MKALDTKEGGSVTGALVGWRSRARRGKKRVYFHSMFCVLTRQQHEGRFLWAPKCNVVVGGWVWGADCCREVRLENVFPTPR